MVNHLERREYHWAIVDMIGKDGHIRTIPVPDWVREKGTFRFFPYFGDRYAAASGLHFDLLPTTGSRAGRLSLCPFGAGDFISGTGLRATQ
jgi:hypothetical protein